MLKTLGENTRYAIYLELARSPRPRSTAEVAEVLDLHPNTVRPHLERMRDAGLVDFESHSRGVGRPQHRYFLAPDAPALGLEPPAMPRLAVMLARTARLAGTGAAEALEAGREQGRLDARRHVGRPATMAVIEESELLGFDPATVGGPDEVTVAFTHCPFAAAVAEDAEVVCALHRGLVEGLVEGCDPAAVVDDFCSYADRPACQTTVRSGYARATDQGGSW